MEHKLIVAAVTAVVVLVLAGAALLVGAMIRFASEGLGDELIEDDERETEAGV